MNSINQKTIINIKDSKYLNWKVSLKNQLRFLKSRNIEIDCQDLNLSCIDLLEPLTFEYLSNALSTQTPPVLGT